MADDEQFSLCWNNFNTNLSAGFHESLIRGDLVDVSLVAEGQIVKAHRLVLSVCSPLFRKMFTNMPLNTHAFVYLNNVSHSALKDLIQFMYCGEVNVKQDALPAFISTAESLQIKGLTDNDPAPPPPQEPSPPPAPAPAPIVQQQPPQPVPAQRVQRQQPRASARYKIETVDDGLGDDNKGTTQIVIQTSAPQAIVQQQAQQHIQTQQMQTGTTTTATLVSTNKRAAQRSVLTGVVKRSKATATTASANFIERLDSGAETATTSTAQLVPQQITVQTVSAAESKPHPQQLRQQAQQQQQQQQEEAEYIDLPMELPTKAEPEYSEDHGDAAGDGDATYVEDDTYGDLRYDDSYFTENEDTGPQATANTSGSSATATTSKAVVKTQTYSDSSFVDTSADPGNTEAQDFLELNSAILSLFGDEGFLPTTLGSGPLTMRYRLSEKRKCARTLDDWDLVRFERTCDGDILIYNGKQYMYYASYQDNIYWACCTSQCMANMITHRTKPYCVALWGAHNHKAGGFWKRTTGQDCAAASRGEVRQESQLCHAHLLDLLQKGCDCVSIQSCDRTGQEWPIPCHQVQL
ncbi:modifier of mdg4-like isoform X1 [Drosophila miranda]|uniref:modifier of mdg4-like isoform X1 n=1 Tax=Drosophila miranda TaxID=7229 RepID=UPI00143FA2B8|nr:modifier of mdg4-like isoform X1 [Drosophila miranda]